MLRVLTVTLNPALDVVYEAHGFAVGRINRPNGKTASAGGKGINVARAYRALGGEATATGLLGGSVGRDIQEAMRSEGMPAAFVSIGGESRINIKISDSETGAQTELNETGPVVSPQEYESLLGRVRELLPTFDVLVLSGSVPPGVPDDVYAVLTRIARDEFGVDTLLDASGDALRAGVEACPAIVKPNRDEAAGIGVKPVRWQDAATEMRERFGLRVVLVTAGAAGAVIDNGQGRWQAEPPSIVVKSAVGSGDSLTAGLLSAWTDGDAAVALKVGVAAGAVNAESYRSGDISADAVRAMAERVGVSEF